MSAGQLLQQNRELAPVAPILPEATREPLPAELKPLEPKPGQMTFVVQQFVFVGNSKMSDEQLQGLVKDLLNKPITFDDLRLATDVVTEFYRERGWLVRAILPQQDITEGTVTIRVIEARLGGIRIDNRSEHVTDERIASWVHARVAQAAELSLDQLDHALLTLNDSPDIAVNHTLQEGDKPGETLLLLTVDDKPRLDGMVSMDSFGDNNSGKVRTSALLNVNGALGMGDQLALFGMYSEGTSYVRFSFTAPVGSKGLRAGVNGSSMTYRVLNQSFQSLNANGYANTGGLEATYPILRSRPANLMTTFNWNYSQFKNWTLNGLNTDQTYDTSVGQIGLTGNLLDNWGGGGLNVGSLVASMGNINRDGGGTYNTNYGAAGSFAKLRYGYNRTQAVNGTLSAYVSVSGQLASKNMDSSEQLYLGGPTSVRAYGAGQGASSQGNLASVELRQSLSYQTVLAAFYDLGNVQTWKSNNLSVNAVDNYYVLQGLGASLSWMGPQGLNLKATWAHRTGALSPSVANQLSQNGGTSLNRLWLNASLSF